MLLTHYKDQPECVMRIMDSLLDREIHPQFKSPILAQYFVCNGSRLGNPSAGGVLSNHVQGNNNNNAVGNSGPSQSQNQLRNMPHGDVRNHQSLAERFVTVMSTCEAHLNVILLQIGRAQL